MSRNDDNCRRGGTHPQRRAALLFTHPQELFSAWTACLIVILTFASGLIAKDRDKASETNITIVSASRDEEEHGWLGVWLDELTPRLRDRYDIDVEKGAFVVEVVDDSPADKAGIRDHDVIISFNGEKIEDDSDLTAALKETKPRDEVEIELVRGKERKTVTVRLRRPPRDVVSIVVPKPPKPPRPQVWFGSVETSYLGVELQDLNEDLMRYFRLKEPKGALVTEVDEGSPSDEAGIKAGDVIVRIDDERVESPEDVEDILSDEYEPGDEVEITVLRDGREKTFTVKLGEPKSGPFFRKGFLWRTYPNKEYILKYRDNLERYQDDLKKLLEKQVEHKVELQKRRLEAQMKALEKQLQSLERQLKRLRQQVRKLEESK